MNILMAADRNMLNGVEMVIYSTMLNNRDVDWYIFTMDIRCKICGAWKDFYRLDENDEAWLQSIVSYHDSNSRLKVINVDSWYAAYLEGNPNQESAFTPFTTLRLLADIVLDGLDHILYLDCDVIVQKDISEMYWSYLKKGHDYYAYSLPEACDWKGEMVAGVLLFDLARVRKSGLLERARRNIHEHEYRFPDQMAIRDAGDPYPLQETYNYMYALYKLSYVPHIIHFTNEIHGKIYLDGKTVFYRKFPQFRYIEDGLQIVRSLGSS